MPKLSISRMGLALLLLYGIVPVLFGYLIVREWAAERTVLVACGATFLLTGSAMLGSAFWLLISLGRPRLPLWIGGNASIVSGGVLAGRGVGKSGWPFGRAFDRLT